MPAPLDASAITHGIQLAIAPVFLLTAVSGMIDGLLRFGKVPPLPSGKQWRNWGW